MKVSLNWAKEYAAIDMPTDELLARIGAQLGEIDGVEYLAQKYQGVLVVKVVTCEDHPNADRLRVCKIDDGGVAQSVERDSDGLVQVVCGAPNVRQGITVAWLPPGSTVPASVEKAPFVLDSRELRGVLSHGMLASPQELAIGESHDGILELEDTLAAGTGFLEAYALDDVVVDIENKMFTHRPDCFGQLGVARELAGITGTPFTSPDWYKTYELTVADTAATLPLHVVNELPQLVPRFMAVSLSGITIKPSPVRMQSLLSRVGIRPINNVVDITNYIMMLTGQPLHAYDYDKVVALSDKDATIVVRNPRSEEKLTLLNGKTVQPRAEAIMIATDKQAIGLGGVMGGGDTEVDENTTNVILEVATFDMYSIRRTSMAHGLFTDAVTRFNKGQSPLQNDRILNEAVRLLGEYAGAKMASQVIDESQVTGREWVHPPVPVAASFINERLGLSLSASDMRHLLENVEFTVTIEGELLHVEAPRWRTDIETREDVVEEIGRLYGFDKLPLELPRRAISATPRDPLLELKARIRHILAKAGATELLTYSFVHGKLIDSVGQNKQDAFALSNAISPDLQYYRLSLLPSLLDKVHPNIKAGYERFSLFEMGKTHTIHEHDDQGLPLERDILAMVVAASKKAAPASAAYYDAKHQLQFLAAQLGLSLRFEPYDNRSSTPIEQPYEPGRTALVKIASTDLVVGIIGEFRVGVKRALKLPEYTAGFSLQLAELLQACTTSDNSAYHQLPRFPKVTQDITLRVAASTSYQALHDCLVESLTASAADNALVTVECTSIYQRPDDTDHKQISFRYSVASYERTLTDSEVSQHLATAAEVAAAQLNASTL